VENAYIAPRTPIEAQLTEIAAQLLGVARVGIDDNFFDLGGHSLLATQFLSRIRASFQVEVPLRSLFEKPSIAQIAADVEQARESATAPGAPPIARISRESRRAKRSQFSWHEP
jgi:acyl carrier protein